MPASERLREDDLPAAAGVTEPRETPGRNQRGTVGAAGSAGCGTAEGAPHSDRVPGREKRDERGRKNQALWGRKETREEPV